MPTYWVRKAEHTQANNNKPEKLQERKRREYGFDTPKKNGLLYSILGVGSRTCLDTTHANLAVCFPWLRRQRTECTAAHGRIDQRMDGGGGGRLVVSRAVLGIDGGPATRTRVIMHGFFGGTLDLIVICHWQSGRHSA